MSPQRLSGPWPLVGRSLEIETFERTLRQGTARGITVHGPAGVGKTRLAEECLVRARQAGHPAGRAVATAVAARLPLGCIAHLLPQGLDLSDPVAGFAAARRALRPRDARPVWLIDDAPLLDAASATLLGELLDSEAVFLLATVRSGEPSGEQVRALERGDAMERIDLAAFDPGQVAGLLQQVLGGPVTTGAAHRLHALSEGNALFLHELVKSALRSGALAASPAGVWELTAGLTGTPRLGELLQTRLADTTAAQRTALELLACCGPLGLADVEAEAGTGVCAELEAQGLIRVRLEARRTLVDLAHALYGELLRQATGLLRRRALMARQADRCAARGTRRRQDSLHLASLRLLSTGSADPALLIEAAAIARHAHDYTQAIELLNALPADRHTTVTRCSLGAALYDNCAYEQAETVFAQALEHAATEEELLVAATQRAENLCWGLGRPDSALEICHALRDRITRPEWRDILDAAMASLHTFTGEPRAAIECLHAIETVDRTSVLDGTFTYYGRLCQGLALRAVGRLTEAAEVAARACTEARRSEATGEFPALQLLPLVFALTDAGELARADEVAREALADSVAAGAPSPSTWLPYVLGRRGWLAGKPAQARRWYAEALAMGRRHAPAMIRPAASGLAACEAVLGDLEAAQAALADLDGRPRAGFFGGEEVLGEAWLLAARGDTRRACRLLTEAAAVAGERSQVVSEVFLLTEAARLGAAQQAAPRLAELTAQCERRFTPARAAFAAALASRDPEELLAAADALEDLGADLLAAEAVTAAAVGWARAGRRREAAAATLRAQAVAERCEGARTPALALIAVAAVPLTDREREVALLAAAGASSRDIAENLVVSVRTVDNHLQRVYAKLGVSRRTELAGSLALARRETC